MACRTTKKSGAGASSNSAKSDSLSVVVFSLCLLTSNQQTTRRLISCRVLRTCALRGGNAGNAVTWWNSRARLRSSFASGVRSAKARHSAPREFQRHRRGRFDRLLADSRALWRDALSLALLLRRKRLVGGGQDGFRERLDVELRSFQRPSGVGQLGRMLRFLIVKAKR
jgi:hypothetical protein